MISCCSYRAVAASGDERQQWAVSGADESGWCIRISYKVILYSILLYVEYWCIAFLYGYIFILVYDCSLLLYILYSAPVIYTNNSILILLSLFH